MIEQLKDLKRKVDMLVNILIEKEILNNTDCLKLVTFEVVTDKNFDELEFIKAEMCKKYCRFPLKCSDYDKMLEEHCADCPLGKLKESEE